jgi:hypothetical protein
LTIHSLPPGADRADLQLAHNASGLINEVARTCADTIVVIHSGQTVDMEAWIENDNVTAVVFVRLLVRSHLLEVSRRLTDALPPIDR